MAARPELTTGVVIRLTSHEIAKRFSANGTIEPQHADFRLPDADRARLKTNGGTGGLSVWDRALTTPQQAQQFLTPNHRIVLDLDVQRITILGLRVFRAPLN